MARVGRRVRIEVEGVIREVEVAPDGSISIEGRADAVRVMRADHASVHVQIAGRRVLVYVTSEGMRCWAFAEGRPFQLDLSPGGAQPQRTSDPARSLAAPMPASVLSTLVKAGQLVRRGDPLVLLEAMKMEIAVRAPHDATIAAVNCKAGDLVQPGIPLVVLAGDDSQSD